VAWVLYTFNFSLPKINVKLEKYKRKHTSRVSSRPSKATKQTTDAIAKKINQSKQDFRVQTSQQDVSRSFIKSMIKQKTEQKLFDKKPKPMIKFSGDKPTFDISLLKSNT